MAERTHIPSSPACGEWETLLADALDGLLRPEDETRFTAHKADCPACAALYEEARKGREWLEFLSPEPDAPDGLLEKILAQTGPGHVTGHAAAGNMLPVAAGAGGVPAFMPPVWQQPGFFARARYAAQPRLLMTAAMAFFSIALTLNMTGVRVSDLRLADLRPRALRSYMERQLTMASVPIVRYYDHLRFVYEVESRVRELRGKGEGEGNDDERNQTQPAAPGQTRQNPEQRPGSKDGGTRVDPPQQSGSPAMEPASDESNDFLEAALACRECAFGEASISNAGPRSTAIAFPPQRREPVAGAPAFAISAQGRLSTQSAAEFAQDDHYRDMEACERNTQWIA